MKSSKTLNGFTVTELLIVIAVIGFVLVLLLPVVSKMRKGAQNVQCVNNLKQMGVGLLNYVGEHDGKLIPGAMLPTGWYWYHALDAYMGQTDSDWLSPNRPKWQLCPNHKVKPMTYVTIGYGWNYHNFGQSVAASPSGNTPGTGYNSRMSEVAFPGRTIIIGDNVDAEYDPTPAGNFRYRLLYPFVGLHAQRHSGMGNYLMLDGHVESLPPDFDGTLLHKTK